MEKYYARQIQADQAGISETGPLLEGNSLKELRNKIKLCPAQYSVWLIYKTAPTGNKTNIIELYKP